MNSEDRPEVFSSSKMELSVGQQFELEKMSRAIDNCMDMEELKSLTKSLTSSWMTQQAAIAWMLRLQLERDHPDRNK